MRYPSSSAASKSFEVDELAVVDLVRLDDLVGRDLASLLLADLLVPDRRAVLLVDEMELEIVLVDRAVHPHRRVDEPEGDAARPDRARHPVPIPVRNEPETALRLTLASGGCAQHRYVPGSAGPLSASVHAR